MLSITIKRLQELYLSLSVGDAVSAPTRRQKLKALRIPILLAALAPMFGGCFSASLSEPDRLLSVDAETTMIRSAFAFDDPKTMYERYQAAADKVAFRNALLAARMYAIDLQYTEYEGKIIREGQAIDFGTKVTQGVLTTVSGLVTPIGTSHALSATATLINGVDTAYNDKILKSHVIQSVLSSMRSARNEQAAVIYANMTCSISAYPVGMALSDLEAYFRAGTFQTGLIKLMQTVGKAESDAKATQDASKPAASAEATAKIEANKKEAEVKAEANVVLNEDCVPRKGGKKFARGIVSRTPTSTFANQGRTPSMAPAVVKPDESPTGSVRVR